MKATPVSEARRRALCAAPVTLDGQRAHVTGARNDVATIVATVSGVSFQWAWAAVVHVVDNRNGEFTS